MRRVFRLPANAADATARAAGADGAPANGSSATTAETTFGGGRKAPGFTSKSRSARAWSATSTERKP